MTRQTDAAVGEEIRRRRDALGLSRIGLAYKAGVDLTTVRRIEEGEVSPRRSTMAVIEQALSEAEAEVPA